MEISRINKSEIYVLSLTLDQINNSIDYIDSLNTKLDEAQEKIKRKISKNAKFHKLIDKEEVIKNAVFSETSSLSSDIKNISSNLVDEMIVPISDLPQLQSFGALDFKSNDEKTILSYRPSPLYEDIIEIVGFTKKIFKNIKFFAAKTVEKKDIEESVNNDKSIFIVFLKKLAVNMSEVQDLIEILNKQREVMEDSALISQAIIDSAVTETEFYNLTDNEKINIISG